MNMKSLINTKVQHSEYGIGTITSISEDRIMTIDFPEVGKKKFAYPDDFCKSIKSVEVEIQQEAENAMKLKVEGIRNNVKNILENIDEDVQFNDTTNRLFIVHQGKTYYEELISGYVWAPQSGIHHHEKMTDIHKGDIVFNYANGAIQAVSEALCDCFDSPIPSELNGYGWSSIGYRVRLRYCTLTNPVYLRTICSQISIMRANMYSSFNCNGSACQGYMYELEHNIALIIKDLIMKTPQTAGVKSILNRIH